MSEAIQETEPNPPAEETLPTGEETDQTAELTEAEAYRARVASDPEFALEQIAIRDKKLGEHGRRMKSLEQVEQMVNLAGSTENVMSYLQTVARIQQMPELANLVNTSLQQGRLALPEQTAHETPDEPEEWIDPEIKSAVSPIAAQVEELKQVVESLTGQLTQTDLRSQEQQVAQNSKVALERFSSNPEALKAAEDLLEQEIRATYQRAQAGDPEAVKLYKNIAAPGGERVLRSALMDLHDEWAPKLYGGPAQPSEPNAEEVLGRSTDPRPVNAARPGTVQIPAPPKGKMGVNHVVDVMRAAGRQLGVDTSKL